MAAVSKEARATGGDQSQRDDQVPSREDRSRPERRSMGRSESELSTIQDRGEEPSRVDHPGTHHRQDPGRQLGAGFGHPDPTVQSRGNVTPRRELEHGSSPGVDPLIKCL